MIPKEKESEVLRLYHGEKWPIGTIAAQLGLHHTTVQRVLRHTGVEAKVVAPRPSMVDPFVPFIVEQLKKYPALRASRLFTMIKERGYPGCPDHFRRVVGRLRPKKAAEAFLRLRTLPGEQAQVDWAHFGKLTVGRAERPLWAFVMVLSFSRRVFLRFFPGAAMPFFLRGHVEAFAELGGVPRVALYDNLKSAVLERRGDVIRFHPTLLDLSAHYRFDPRPVAVARGNEKGRVERAIRYIREGFFEARAFADLSDLNRQAIAWTAGASLDRPWVEDRERSVRQAFEDEKDRLLPLPDNPFEAAERAEVEVGKTPYARFDLNDYSVPHDRTRRTLVVFADLDTVRILDGDVVVASHPRSWDRGQQIEEIAHIERLVDDKRRAREHRGLDRLARAARSSQAFLKAIAERGGNIGSTTARLLQILDAAGPADLEEALVEALEHDALHVGAVRQIVDRLRTTRGLPPPVSIPLARGEHAGLVITPHALATYDTLKTEKTS
jgi:transposase